MYSLSDLYRGVRHPDALGREINRQYHTRLSTRDHNTAGTDVFAEDWDNMIILDACRFDEFARSDYPDGTLESRISKGSTTEEFVRANFTNKSLHDVVYVAANNWFARLAEEIDSEVYDLETLIDEEYWDDTKGTILPKYVTEAAIRMAQEYQNKRLLIHYLQPHYPFIGDFGKALLSRGSTRLMTQIRRGEIEISDKNLRRAYRENLDIVLEEVDKLLKTLTGRTVITADHGEMLGERYRPFPMKGYGHHRGIYVDELVEVPWLIIDQGARREITSEPPQEYDTEGVQKQVVDRLRQLGYKE